MRITFDAGKRLKTLHERGLDFCDAVYVFRGEVLEFEDIRKNYDEKRIIAIGYLMERMVVIGYVIRGSKRHIFSMRKANVREIKKYQKQFEQD